MSRVLTRRLLPTGLVALVQMSEIADGDFAVADSDGLLSERRCVLTGTDGAESVWTWLTQTHGTTVVAVEKPGGGAGSVGDAAVTMQHGCILSVQVADCAPVALIADEGGLAVVHAGWRGLAEGVLESASGALRNLVDGPQRAVVGPCIHPCCYEFDSRDLAELIEQLDWDARKKTRGGRPALDLPGAVVAALERIGVVDLEVDEVCTYCDDRYWSYRATGTTSRQAMVVELQAGKVQFVS